MRRRPVSPRPIESKIPSVAALAAPIPLPRITASDRTLKIALAVSIALHAIVLSIRFKFPDAFDFKNAPQLEVTLVNSKSETRPDQPNILAQTNLDGGGNTDQNRKAKTPMPVLPTTNRGADVVEQSQRRVQQLQQQEQELLAKVQEKRNELTVPPPPAQSTPQPTPEPPAPELQGQDLAARALAMMRMEAQLARQIDAYEKRPKKNFVGARAAEYRFARYVDDWRIKVERIGNANYPADARGRLYGSLQLTVAIKADGTLDSIEFNRPSGYPVLDRAAERIVKMAAPFAPFPPDVRRDTDILVITRTWIFAPGDKLQSE